MEKRGDTFFIEKILQCPSRGKKMRECMKEIYNEMKNRETLRTVFNQFDYFCVLYIAKLFESSYTHHEMNTLIKPLLHISEDNLNLKTLHVVGEHIFSYLDSNVHDLKKEKLLNFYLEMIDIGVRKDIDPNIIFPLNEMTLYKFVDHILACENVMLQSVELQVLYILLPDITKEIAQQFFPGKQSLQTALQAFKQSTFDTNVQAFINCINSQKQDIFSMEITFIAIGVKKYGKNHRTYVDFNTTQQRVTFKILTETPNNPIAIVIERANIELVSSKEMAKVESAEILIVLKDAMSIPQLKHSRIKNIKFRFTLQALQATLTYKTNDSFLELFFGNLEVFRNFPNRFHSNFSDVTRIQSAVTVRPYSWSELTSITGSRTLDFSKEKVLTMSVTQASKHVLSESASTNNELNYFDFSAPHASTPDLINNSDSICSLPKRVRYTDNTEISPIVQLDTVKGPVVNTNERQMKESGTSFVQSSLRTSFSASMLTFDFESDTNPSGKSPDETIVFPKKQSALNTKYVSDESPASDLTLCVGISSPDQTIINRESSSPSVNFDSISNRYVSTASRGNSFVRAYHTETSSRDHDSNYGINTDTMNTPVTDVADIIPDLDSNLESITDISNERRSPYVLEPNEKGSALNQDTWFSVSSKNESTLDGIAPASESYSIVSMSQVPETNLPNIYQDLENTFYSVSSNFSEVRSHPDSASNQTLKTVKTIAGLEQNPDNSRYIGASSSESESDSNQVRVPSEQFFENRDHPSIRYEFKQENGAEVESSDITAKYYTPEIGVEETDSAQLQERMIPDDTSRRYELETGSTKTTEVVIEVKNDSTTGYYSAKITEDSTPSVQAPKSSTNTVKDCSSNQKLVVLQNVLLETRNIERNKSAGKNFTDISSKDEIAVLDPMAPIEDPQESSLNPTIEDNQLLREDTQGRTEVYETAANFVATQIPEDEMQTFQFSGQIIRTYSRKSSLEHSSIYSHIVKSVQSTNYEEGTLSALGSLRSSKSTIVQPLLKEKSFNSDVFNRTTNDTCSDLNLVLSPDNTTPKNQVSGKVRARSESRDCSTVGSTEIVEALTSPEMLECSVPSQPPLLSPKYGNVEINIVDSPVENMEVDVQEIHRVTTDFVEPIPSRSSSSNICDSEPENRTENNQLLNNADCIAKNNMVTDMVEESSIIMDVVDDPLLQGIEQGTAVEDQIVAIAYNSSLSVEKPDAGIEDERHSPTPKSNETDIVRIHEDVISKNTSYEEYESPYFRKSSSLSDARKRKIRSEADLIPSQTKKHSTVSVQQTSSSIAEFNSALQPSVVDNHAVTEQENLPNIPNDDSFNESVAFSDMLDKLNGQVEGICQKLSRVNSSASLFSADNRQSPPQVPIWDENASATNMSLCSMQAPSTARSDSIQFSAGVERSPHYTDDFNAAEFLNDPIKKAAAIKSMKCIRKRIERLNRSWRSEDQERALIRTLPPHVQRYVHETCQEIKDKLNDIMLGLLMDDLRDSEQ